MIISINLYDKFIIMILIVFNLATLVSSRRSTSSSTKQFKVTLFG